MNPVAFIAFLMGINSGTPAMPAPAQKQETVKERTKPTSDQGTPKGGSDGEGRGGWDRN